MVNNWAAAPATAPKESSVAMLGCFGDALDEMYSVRTREYQ